MAIQLEALLFHKGGLVVNMEYVDVDSDPARRGGGMVKMYRGGIAGISFHVVFVFFFLLWI